MKISELIEQLQKLQSEHGDLRIGVDDYNNGYGGAGEPYLDVCGRRNSYTDEVLTIVKIAAGQIIYR